MRCVIVREPGGAEVLQIADLPEPVAAGGQLLVRNFAAGLNRADLLQRRGLYPPPAGESDILGLEFAGEVAAVGEGVEGFTRGDRVFGLCAGGAYADFLVVDARLALEIPSNMSYEAAAAVPEAFYTAEDAYNNTSGIGQTNQFNTKNIGENHLGEEIDFTLTHNYNPSTNIVFGYTHFFTDELMEDVNHRFQGGAVDGNEDGGDTDWAYIMLDMQF